MKRTVNTAIGTCLSVAVSLLVGGCPQVLSCEDLCDRDLRTREGQCRDLFMPQDPEAFGDCLDNAFVDWQTCRLNCPGGILSSLAAPGPSYHAILDVDWSAVNPFFVQVGTTVELIVEDVDMSAGLDQIIQMLPSPSDVQGWQGLRAQLVFPELQGDITVATFDYLPLSDVLDLGGQVYEVGPGSPWIDLGVDDVPQDGFSFSLDTSDLNPDWYVIRVFLADGDPSKSRFGFGSLNIVNFD